MALMQIVPKAGDVVAGKYQVTRVLGAGGMGVVVAARHLHLDQMVALKFMLPVAIDTPTGLERFFREAQAAFRLASEHVARVLDVGTFAEGSPYIVMEYLVGTNLADLLLAHKQLHVPRVVDYVLQACEAIAEAHALGFVHRDIKPANLFLTTRPDGSPLVKVLDFGISKLTATLLGQSQGALTKTNRAVGSPHYMAPEQMTSPKTVDRRADIWSLGVVMFELCTGELPFAAPSLPDLCLQIVRDKPAPMRGRNIPAGFPDLVLRCLEKDPNKRFANIGEMAEALAMYSESGARTSLKRIVGVTRMEKTPSPQRPPLEASPLAAADDESADDVHIEVYISDERSLEIDNFASDDTLADQNTKRGV